MGPDKLRKVDFFFRGERIGKIDSHEELIPTYFEEPKCVFWQSMTNLEKTARKWATN